jgi:hypothetical protein
MADPAVFVKNLQSCGGGRRIVIRKVRAITNAYAKLKIQHNGEMKNG